MIIFLALIIAFFTVLLGRYIFKGWVNHLSLYGAIWGGMIFLYELKLISYIDISVETWTVILAAYFSLIGGTLTVYLARKLHKKQFCEYKSLFENVLFNNDCRVLKLIILGSSIIGFIAAFQHWSVLLRDYGSIANVFLNGNEIYKMRVSGELKGVIPYVSSFGFVGVFFAGILVGYKNKLTLLSIFPMSAVIIQQIANFSRADMLFALILFTLTIFFVKKSVTIKVKMSRGKKILFSASIVFALALALFGAGMVRSTRGTIESFSGTSSSLRAFQDNIILTPSLYMYLSGHIGTLTKYFEKSADEEPVYGKMTFQPIANILAKFGFIEKPPNYISAYYIPVWINTSTYLRLVYMDFKIWGVLLIPYLLGLLITYFWYKYFESSDFYYLVLLVYFNVVIAFTFLTLYTRSGSWFISMIINLGIIKFLKIRYPEVPKTEELES